MKKKILTAVLAGAMTVFLAACTGGNVSSVPANSESVKQPEAEIESTAAQVETEAESMVQEAEALEAPDFSGTWVENTAGRGRIDIVSTGENTYTVTVCWSSSAFESSNWEMNATYYDSTGLLEYSDAKYYIRTYTDDENYTDDVKYEDGGGCMWIEENGTLGWQSAEADVDYVDGSSFFELLPQE